MERVESIMNLLKEVELMLGPEACWSLCSYLAAEWDDLALIQPLLHYMIELKTKMMYENA